MQNKLNENNTEITGAEVNISSKLMHKQEFEFAKVYLHFAWWNTNFCLTLI